MTLVVGALGGCSAANPTPRDLSAEATRGQAIAGRLGCTSCHSTNGDPGVGPTWAGSWGDTVRLADGTSVNFDDRYVSVSVRDPSRQRRDGSWVQMPPFGPNRISDDEIADITAYIQSLASVP